MVQNFCSLFLGKIYEDDKEKRQILDENGNPITTIQMECGTGFIIGFSKPKLTYDIFGKDKLKIPKIIRYGRKMDDYIKKIGVRVVSFKVRSRTERWLTWQKTRYEVILLNSIIPTDASIVKIPDEHWVEYDSNNARVRMSGKYTTPIGYTKWIYL